MANGKSSRRAAARRAARKQGTRAPAPQKAQPGARVAGTGTRPAAAAEAPAEALSRALRIAWWALVAMVFLVPLAMSDLTFLGFGRPFTYSYFQLVKVFCERVLGLVALGAWAWHMLRRGGRLRHTPVDWLIVAFLGWVALTTVTSVHWPMSLFGQRNRYEGLLSFVNYAVIYFLVLQFADRAERLRTLARSLFFSSVIVAGYGVLQSAGWDPIQWGALPFEADRAFSTYGNPDLLGGFLIFSVTVGLALALSEERIVWRLVYWAGFALNGVALIVSFTRGAWIGGALSLALMGVIAWRQGVRARRADLVPAGLGAALGAGIIWRSFSSTSEVMNFGKRLGSILQFSSGSGQTRTEIWQAAWAAVKERPILGWGPDTFGLVFPRFKSVDYVRHAGITSVADNAHDYPLHLAAGVGIPGMLLMYGIFIWAGVRSFATVFGRRDDTARIVRGAFWAAAAGYLLQLSFGISLPGVTFLLWVALGALLAPTASVAMVRAPRWGRAAAVVVVALAALGVGYQGVLVAADNAFLAAHLDSTGVARAQAARRAVRLNPFDDQYRTQVGLADKANVESYHAAITRALQAGQDPKVFQDAMAASFASAEAAFKDAIAFVPDEYDNYVYLAQLYILGAETMDGRNYDSAITVAREGLALEPDNPVIRVPLARALLSTGKADEGIKELEYCLQIDPSYADAALLLAQAYEVQKRPDDALAVLKTVEALVPGQPGVVETIQRLEAGRSPSP